MESLVLQFGRVRVILWLVVRERIGIFVIEVWVVPPSWIEGICVGVILWSVIKIVENITLLNG